MKTSEIKNIVLVYNDSDYVRVWHWIANVLLFTVKNKNLCDENMLVNSDDIIRFVKSLIPTALEFAQYRTDEYKLGCNTSDIDYIANRLMKYTEQFDTHTNYGICFNTGSDIVPNQGAMVIDLVTSKILI